MFLIHLPVKTETARSDDDRTFRAEGEHGARLPHASTDHVEASVGGIKDAMCLLGAALMTGSARAQRRFEFFNTRESYRDLRINNRIDCEYVSIRLVG